ncbi:MAG TPA: hypothetical protein VHT91_13775 [Kofleriaceae bacterium]|nr:hypothetical protein [Kofleriaceae bacterium]
MGWVSTQVQHGSFLLCRNGSHSTHLGAAARAWLRRRRRVALDRAVPAPQPGRLDAQAPRGAWDLVVCRNVLIYFAPPAARRPPPAGAVRARGA